MRRAGLALLALLFAAWWAVAAETAIAPFSRAIAGAAIPGAWKPLGLPKRKMPTFRLVDDGGTVVLQANADDAVGTMAHALEVEPGTFHWRWKVDRVVPDGDMHSKSHEDFAARVYVFFDVPREVLPLATRAKMRLAALLYGAELPTATICYVWDNKNPIGTHAMSPFTDTVHTWVVQTGNASAGKWVAESRNLEVDFRAAFGHYWKGPVPKVTGIAVGLDTDQTHENITASFGDLAIEARR